MNPFFTGQCVLRTLENPTLNGILLGLDIKDFDFQIREDMFPCCAGKGERFQPTQQTLVRCSLKSRLARTRQLMTQYYQTWGERFPALPHLLPERTTAGLLLELANVLKGNRPPGTLKKGQKGRPGEFFAMALAAAWRFGMEVRMITFGKTKIDEVLQQSTSQPRAVILVEQVDGLWEPGQASQLEALIGWVYRSNSYLWLEFTQNEEKGKVAGAVSAREQFATRIAQFKAKSPFDFLEDAAKSRLTTLCSVPRTQFEEFF